jgi:hypothetical protein
MDEEHHAASFRVFNQVRLAVEPFDHRARNVRFVSPPATRKKLTKKDGSTSGGYMRLPTTAQERAGTGGNKS